MQYNYKLIFFTTILLANFNLIASVAATSETEEKIQRTSRVFTSLEEKREFLLQHSYDYSAGNSLPLGVIQAIRSGELGSEIFNLTGNKNFTLLLNFCRIAIQMRDSFTHVLPFETPANGIELQPIPITGFVSLSPSAFSELPLAENMYLLNIRSNLQNPTSFASSLAKLDELTTLAQTEALETKNNKKIERAKFLVDLTPYIRTISTKISEYLRFVLAEKSKLQPNAVSKLMAWVKTPPPKSEITLAQEAEVNVREALAYTIFDSVFGNISMPASVEAALYLEKDDSAKNRLQKRVKGLYDTLRTIQHFKAKDTIVDHTGEIISQATKPMNGIRANTKLNDNDEFIAALRTQTANLLATINAAVQYATTKNTFPNSKKSFALYSSAEAVNEHLKKSATDGFVEVSEADHNLSKQ